MLQANSLMVGSQKTTDADITHVYDVPGSVSIVDAYVISEAQHVSRPLKDVDSRDWI